ncbi:MAG: hypothetical protein AB2815_00655, partial [Candidatus Sedimenticola endophacoides]
MVICPTLDQVTVKFALREQGISGDGSPGDFDGQECRYLVKDFGTSQSPKSTRQRDSRYCPD